MNSSEKYKKQQEYDSMVKKASPNSPLLSDCIKAFVSGGLICSFAQVMRNWFLAKGLSQDDTGLAVSLILIGIRIVRYNRKILRSRDCSADHRICQFRCFTCHRI